MKIKLLLSIIFVVLMQSCFLVDTAIIAGTGPLTINDNTSGSIAAVQADPGIVYSMDSVTVNGLVHSWAADLTITLTTPDGTSCILVDGDGEDNDYNGNYTFVSSDNSDFPSLYDYSGEVYAAGEIIPQTLRAKGELQNLTPDDMAGDWTLTISDSRTDDTGTCDSFSVTLTYFIPWW